MSSTASDQLSLAKVYYQEQRYPEAKTALEHAVREQPDLAEAWQLLGLSYYCLQDYAQSESAQRKSLALAQVAHTYFGLGLALAAQAKYDEAISSFDKALELEPNNQHARASLVETLINQGQERLAGNNFPVAERSLDRAIKLNRSDPRPVVLLARHFAASNLEGRAKQIVSEAVGHGAKSDDLTALVQELGIQALPSATAGVQKQQARDAVAKSEQIPCPICKMPIMEWATTCPYCKQRIRQSTMMAAAEAIKPSWQEVAYKIITVLWILQGAWSIYSGLQFVESVDRGTRELTGAGASNVGGMTGYFWVIGLVQIALGIGLWFENETVQFIAKIICYLALLVNGLAFIQSVALGHGLAIVISLVQLSITCLTMYLISYASGDSAMGV